MGIVDFHTHILPYIDDGSDSVETSLQMLRAEAEQGVERVIATPHFYANHDSPEKFLKKRDEAYNKLMEKLENKQGLPQIFVGAEVYFFEGMSDCDYLKDMAISGTDCIMVEMPMTQWSDRNLKELENIRQKQKLTPIIAHIDRYIKPFGAKKLCERICSYPVLVQANASFFAKKSTKRLALKLFKTGKIHLVGTDCHNLDTRQVNIGLAVRTLQDTLGDRAIQSINRLENRILGSLG